MSLPQLISNSLPQFSKVSLVPSQLPSNLSGTINWTLNNSHINGRSVMLNLQISGSLVYPQTASYDMTGNNVSMVVVRLFDLFQNIQLSHNGQQLVNMNSNTYMLRQRVWDYIKKQSFQKISITQRQYGTAQSVAQFLSLPLNQESDDVSENTEGDFLVIGLCDKNLNDPDVANRTVTILTNIQLALHDLIGSLFQYESLNVSQLKLEITMNPLLAKMLYFVQANSDQGNLNAPNSSSYKIFNPISNGVTNLTWSPTSSETMLIAPQILSQQSLNSQLTFNIDPSYSFINGLVIGLRNITEADNANSASGAITQTSRAFFNPYHILPVQQFTLQIGNIEILNLNKHQLIAFLLQNNYSKRKSYNEAYKNNTMFIPLNINVKNNVSSFVNINVIPEIGKTVAIDLLLLYTKQYHNYQGLFVETSQ